MGKNGKIYAQRFRDEWLEDPRYSHWLQKLDEDDTRCICTLCLSILCAKISDIEKHRNTNKHKKAELGIPINAKRHIGFPIKIEEKLKAKLSRDSSDPDFEGISQNDSENNLETDPIDSTHETSTVIIPVKKRRRYIASSLKSPKILRPQHIKEEETHEIDAFARSIAAQMKSLPERHVLDLFSELQNLVTQRRQLVLEENEKRRSERLSYVPNSQIITVSAPPPEQSMPSFSNNDL